MVAKPWGLVSGPLNPFTPHKRYYPRMTFTSYHENVYEPVKMVNSVEQIKQWSGGVNHHQSPAGTLLLLLFRHPFLFC